MRKTEEAESDKATYEGDDAKEKSTQTLSLLSLGQKMLFNAATVAERKFLMGW